MKKYQEIFNDLKVKITKKVYSPDSHLPTEKELQSIYEASRDTVRKALSMLTEIGYIQKIQGSGSVVLRQDLVDFPVSGLISYQELVDEYRLNSETNVVSLDKIKIDSKLSALTGFEEGITAIKVVRTRAIDSKVVVLDIDYLRADLIENLPLEAAQHSIYNYLENVLFLEIAYAQKEITVVTTSEEEKQLMKHRDDYLVLIRSKVYLRNATQFQYTESKHKLDKFKFVEFARRKHSL